MADTDFNIIQKIRWWVRICTDFSIHLICSWLNTKIQTLHSKCDQIATITNSFVIWKKMIFNLIPSHTTPISMTQKHDTKLKKFLMKLKKSIHGEKYRSSEQNMCIFFRVVYAWECMFGFPDRHSTGWGNPQMNINLSEFMKLWDIYGLRRISSFLFSKIKLNEGLELNNSSNNKVIQQIPPAALKSEYPTYVKLV